MQTNLPESEGSVPPPLAAAVAESERPQPFRSGLALILSLFVAAFLLDGVLSVLDDSLILFGGVHWLSLPRLLLFAVAAVLTLAVYGLIGCLPMIPKRQFLPLVFFGPVAVLVMMLVLIYAYERAQATAWALSLLELGLGVVMLRWIRGRGWWNWPLVPARCLRDRKFSGKHLLGFLAVNLFLLLPLAAVATIACVVLAVDHHSAGFVALRPTGVTVQSREYVRDDGKVIRLYPMAHVGDAGFYQRLSQAFPTNAVILMEGVTDEHGLLTNHINYERMAKALGVAEQGEVFAPRGELVAADVDVSVFSTNTIGFLNVVMRFHSHGLTPETLRMILQYQPAAGFERELLEDLLHKRNRHVLATAQDRLADSDLIVIPWGAAHMPELAREITGLGFRLAQAEQLTVLAFGPAARRPTRDTPAAPPAAQP